MRLSQLRDVDFSQGKPAEFPVLAVQTAKFIHLLDDKGDTASQIDLAPYAKAAMSGNGRVMAGLKGREITLATVEGKTLGVAALADPQPEILPQHVDFQLSPNGRVLVVMSRLSHTLYFHSERGTLLAHYPVGNLTGAQMKFSADSTRLAVHVPNIGAAGGFLLCFNLEKSKAQIGIAVGGLLWRFDHKGSEAAFDISGSGQTVAVAAEGHVYSLDAVGKIRFELPINACPVHVAVSGNGERLAVAQQSDHRVTLFDSTQGSILWQHVIDGFDPLQSPFTSLVFNGSRTDAVCVAVSKSWSGKNEDSQVFLVDGSQSVRWHEKLVASRAVIEAVSGTCCDLIAGNREARLYKL